MTTALIDSVGIEIEFSGIQKSYGDVFKQGLSWRMVEDGSCRTHRGVIPGLPIEAVGSGNSAQFGGEFISPIINTADSKTWKDEVARILEWLGETGEGLGVKTSIHVHVNSSSLPLFAIQNILTIGLFIEAGMFRLSCAEMGVHRGALHLDYGYCRPISKQGPPAIRCADDTIRSVFEVKRLLQAKNLSHLRQGLGRFDRHGGGKYHEARYVWLNLIALYQLGSIEFRLFNSTYAYRNVVAWVDLCQHIIRAGFLPLRELPENPLGSTTIQLEEIIQLLGIHNNKTIYTLEALWNTAGYQRGVMGYQLGHLGHMVNWNRTQKYLVPEIIEDEVLNFRKFSLGNTPQPMVGGWYNIGG